VPETQQKIGLQPPKLFFVSRAGYQCKAKIIILKVLIGHITVTWEIFCCCWLNTWGEDGVRVLSKNIYTVSALQEGRTRGSAMLPVNFCVSI
jgi:hypothetical protein